MDGQAALSSTTRSRSDIRVTVENHTRRDPLMFEGTYWLRASVGADGQLTVARDKVVVCPSSVLTNACLVPPADQPHPPCTHTIAPPSGPTQCPEPSPLPGSSLHPRTSTKRPREPEGLDELNKLPKFQPRFLDMTQEPLELDPILSSLVIVPDGVGPPGPLEHLDAERVGRLRVDSFPPDDPTLAG